MTKDEFIRHLAEAIEVDPGELTDDTDLTQFEGWDSTAVLNLVVLLDEQGVKVDEERIPECKTVRDVVALTGGVLE
ncbi:MAG: acyl carrier protein [Myxococcales bacterium]|nr:acyl carrier protein [Myxococcales bacterium]